MADSPQLPAAASDRRWTFGPAVLDERSLELVVGGEEVEVERKPLQVLLHLLQHAGEVITKDELIAAVWPGRIISDAALTKCMAKLRDALRDDQQSIIKTQHGFGYRLVAQVAVEASRAPVASRLDLKPGDRPPLRPLWGLVERLGQGAHGEVWLARHDKTSEVRVFKFAHSASALRSLKREVTLFRVLNANLGEGASGFVRIMDWAFDAQPPFIESEYIRQRCLLSWCGSQGGLDKVPLAQRLEIAAQAAEAVAKAHAVGVLHKDLKPSNLLIDSDRQGRIWVKLADFGIGALLDAEGAAARDITQDGFLQTGVGPDPTSGTLLYLAPEVLDGQPATARSDIYSLGVLLYQLVVGNFRRVLAPGWETEVADEVLREDIAAAAALRESNRLSTASCFAERLRNLDERQRQRAIDPAGPQLCAILAVAIARTLEDRGDRSLDLPELAESTADELGGTIVSKSPSNIEIEFSGALAATRCALRIQAAAQRYNRDLPVERQLRLRIGVHMGDASNWSEEQEATRSMVLSRVGSSDERLRRAPDAARSQDEHVAKLSSRLMTGATGRSFDEPLARTATPPKPTPLRESSRSRGAQAIAKAARRLVAQSSPDASGVYLSEEVARRVRGRIGNALLEHARDTLVQRVYRVDLPERQTPQPTR